MKVDPHSKQLGLDDTRYQRAVPLTDRQKRIVALLACDCTQSMIATSMNISRSYVGQTVTLLLNNNLIKKKLEQNYNCIYEVSPQLSGIIKETAWVTPVRVHNIAMKFQVTRQTQPVNLDERTGYNRSWPMRGGKWHSFWYPGKAGDPSFTLTLNPSSVIVRMDKGQKIIAETSEEAIDKGYQHCHLVRQKFINAQAQFGVRFEIESVGKRITKAHMGLSLPEKMVPDRVTTIPETHIDASNSEVEPGCVEWESTNPKLIKPLERSIRLVGIFGERTLPEALRQFNKALDPIYNSMQNVEAMVQGSITVAQKEDAIVKFMTKALEEMAEIRRENAELKRELMRLRG